MTKVKIVNNASRWFSLTATEYTSANTFESSDRNSNFTCTGIFNRTWQTAGCDYFLQVTQFFPHVHICNI